MAQSDDPEWLLHWVEIILRAPGLTEWERKFCASIVRQMRRPGWTPSVKQVRVMRRLVEHHRPRLLSEDAA